MRYPSKYVLVTDIDDWSPPSSNGSQTTVAKSSSPQSAASLTAAVSNALGAPSGEFTPNNSKQQPLPELANSKPAMNPPLTVPESPLNDLGNQNSMSSALINNSPAVLLPERVWQDCIMHATPTIPPPQQSPLDEGVGGGGATIKTEPSSNASSTPTSSSSSGSSSGSSSNNENNSSMVTAAALVDANANSVWEITDPTVKVPCSCIKWVFFRARCWLAFTYSPTIAELAAAVPELYQLAYFQFCMLMIFLAVLVFAVYFTSYYFYTFCLCL